MWFGRKSSKFGENTSSLLSMMASIDKLESDLRFLNDQVVEFCIGVKALSNSNLKISEAMMVMFSPDPSLAADAFKFRTVMNRISIVDGAASTVVSAIVSSKPFPHSVILSAMYV